MLREEVRKRVMDEEMNKEAQREANRAAVFANRANSAAGPSRTRQQVIQSSVGTYTRPGFEGQRLSPRLNPEVGGSGSRSSRSIVVDHTPPRKGKGKLIA